MFFYVSTYYSCHNILKVIMYYVTSRTPIMVSSKSYYPQFKTLCRLSSGSLIKPNKLFNSQYRTSSYRSAAQGAYNIKEPETICDFGMFEDPRTEIESMIILNNELNVNLLSRSIPRTNNIVLADGGANHFHALQQYRESEKIRAVVGDLDCIKPQVLDFYNQMKVAVQYQPNLQNNDFSKSLELCLHQNWQKIFVFGAFGGRMDQTLSCMHYCEKYSEIFPNLQIFLFGKSNLMYFLKKDKKYRIKCNEDYVSRFGCGIISFGSVARVETKGFKYNLGEEEKYQKIEWGQFISTSNEMAEDECTIQGSDNLFFVANYSKKMLN